MACACFSLFVGLRLLDAGDRQKILKRDIKLYFEAATEKTKPPLFLLPLPITSNFVASNSKEGRLVERSRLSFADVSCHFRRGGVPA